MLKVGRVRQQVKIALESFSFCSAETPKSWQDLKAFYSLKPALRGGAWV